MKLFDRRALVALWLCVCALACSDDGGGEGDAKADAGAAKPKPGNVLILIADDLGLDSSPCHAYAAELPKAPNIKKICDNGVVFDNTWAAPTCSPTRASILTGRHSFRTGVGAQIEGPDSAGIKLDEHTIPLALDAAMPKTFAHACIGKWHLSVKANGGSENPQKMGFPHYSGLLQGALKDYFVWNRTVNGETNEAKGWAPSVNVDDALAWLKSDARGDKPFFLWVAFNAPHAPFHAPPDDLHTQTLPKNVPNKPVQHYHAMIEALDSEIGRLLAGIGQAELANTHVIFVGDNGSPGLVSSAPVASKMAKGTLYEGGVAVPLAIVGPKVKGPGRSSALVHVLDLYATILELAGATNWQETVPAGRSVDSVSLVPYLEDPTLPSKREHVMTELFDSPKGRDGKAIRNKDYKLIRYDDGDIELFKLADDRWETKERWQNDLSRTNEDKEQKTKLQQALSALTSSK